MIVGTAKNDIADTQKSCSISVRKLGLPCGNSRVQTYTFNMGSKHVDLGAAARGVTSRRAIEAIKVRLGYGVRIYQEQPTNPGPCKELDDRTTSTTTADNTDTKLLESRHCLIAYC